MGDYDDTKYDDIPFPRYKWVVYLEMKPIAINIEADTAEEAMEIANDYDLMGRKGVSLDDIPDLFPVSAKITGVTEEFANIMDKIKTRR